MTALRTPLRTVHLVGTGIASGSPPDDLEDWFPGRWNRNRRMWPDAGLMCHAIAQAAETGRWWRPGSGNTVNGGLVVGADLHALSPTRRFAEVVATGKPVTRATDFLFALPSSCAAIAGIVFGLEQQQTTFTTHGMSGYRALAFGCDLLRTGRMDRVVVAALTALNPEDAAVAAELGLLTDAGDGLHLAVAFSLVAGPDAPARAPLVACEVAAGPDSPDLVPPATHLGLTQDGVAEVPPATPTSHWLEDLPAEYRVLAAPSLLAAARAAANLSGSPVRLAHHDPRAGAAGSLVFQPSRAR